MRRLIVSTFVSLDGVLQAPGGPEEDPSNGFSLGGWTFPYWDDTMDPSSAGFDAGGRELVLGRKTYEIFEAHWPHQPSDDPTAIALNAARKHVASRTLGSLAWENSTLLQGDVVAAITAVKSSPGPDLQVIGSGNLLQTLLPASLVDEFNVWTFPVVLGKGQRLFGTGTPAMGMELVHTNTSASGVVMSTYRPVGPVQCGSFADPEPSAKELSRRRELAAQAGAGGP